MILTALGIIGNALFAFAIWPTTILTIRKGASIGTPINLAWILFSACCCFYTYILGTKGFDWIVACTAVLETVAWGIVIFYHYLPRPERSLPFPG